MIERSPGSGHGKEPEDVRGAPQGASTDEAALAARLERLGDRLETHRSAEAEAAAGKKPSGFAQATKIASEFVAGVIVGGGLGWGIDQALGTRPWALIVFVLLGFAAGVLNVLRSQGVVPDPGVRLREAARGSGTPSDGSEG